MNTNFRENDIKRAQLLFLVINAAFSVLLIIRILRTPHWEPWFIPVVAVMGIGIWIVYFKNLFSMRLRTIVIAGTSLVFLYFYGTHPEVINYEFPLCIGFFTTACAALDEHILTFGGIGGYFFALIYHTIILRDPTVITNNYLSIIVMLTVLFYSRFLIGKHAKELKDFDDNIKKIEQERKSREDFLANVSHELRTPVNAISGMTDVLLKRDLAPEIKEEILAIEKAGRRLSAQIDDILDFSEIISGSLVDESESYFFSDFVRELKTSWKESENEGDNKIVWNIDSKIPAVLLGDKKKIKHVFGNIFGNALKCQAGGTISIDIHARPEEYGINLLISVKDEGGGISQEDIDRAYYGRFEGTNKNNHQEGLKLGLAISNGLVRFMNGFLIFDSSKGEGTTVTITVPQKVVDKEYWREGDVVMDFMDHVLDLSGCRMLVVDDDHMNLNVTKKMLSTYGGEIITVDSGYSALELCKSDEFDLIFMDHMMPGMDGIETYRAIKTHPASKNRDTAFIALTANAVSGAKEMFLEEGFSEFVSKPIDRRALEHAIHKLIKGLEPKDRAERHEHLEIASDISQETTQDNTPEMEVVESSADTASMEAVEPMEVVEAVAPQQAMEDQGGDKLKLLSDYGVNTADALTYCAGSEEFYCMMLSDFCSQIEDKITELSGYMEASDEENYRIKIHALKSNTKTLGFDEISEMARLSEMACKEDRFSEARDSHDSIMAKLKEIEELLTKIQ